MKLAVAVGNNDGLNSKVYGHFGSSPYYAIYDDESNNLEVIKSDNDHKVHGNCQSTVLLSSKGVKAIICGGMGYKAQTKFNAMGIKVYFSDSSTTLNDVIENWKKKELKELSLEEACMGHSHHH
ncbi:MAG: NifB/NifX family molybdenum-iron cluster-binding protein [Brevinematia bacterium]